MLSHMRSRSSVLSHVLGSHPQIVGHGELLRGYRSWIDMAISRIQLNEKSRHKFFHDKLLHDYTLLDESLLLSDRNKIVFLLREPVDSTQSFVRLYRKEKPDCNRDDSAIHRDFFEYYSQRMATLVSMARKIKHRAILIDAEILMQETTKTLARIGNFLELESPLRQEFELHEQSGTSGHGDTTGGLMAGKIQMQQHARATDVDQQLAAKFSEIYRESRLAIEAAGVINDQSC